MSWFRVDDDFSECKKLERIAGNAKLWANAVALWLAAGCYCARNRTDGFVPDSKLPRLTPLRPREVAETAAALADVCELWERVEGGYQFHDWADYNPTAEELDATRDAATERKRQWRKAKRDHAPGHAVTAGVTDSVTPGVTDHGTTAVTDAVTNADVPRVRGRLRARSHPDPISHTHDERAAPDLGGRVLAELQRHPALAAIATEGIAEELATNGTLAGKRPEMIIDAIRQLAAKAGVDAARGAPWTIDALAERAAAFVMSARMRSAAEARPSTAEPPPRARKLLAPASEAGIDYRDAAAGGAS